MAAIILSAIAIWWLIGASYMERPQKSRLAPGLTYERFFDRDLDTWVAVLTADLKQIEPVVVTSSRGMTERDPLTTLAAGDSYLAAVNGDFFNEVGRPEGLVVSEGKMLLAPNGNSGVCFTRAGRASIRRWTFSENAKAVIGTDRYPFAGNGLNRPVVPGRLGVYYLCPAALGAGNPRLAQGIFRITSHGQNRLEGVLANTAFNPSQNLPIPPGHFALVAGNHSDYSEVEGPYGWAKRNWKTLGVSVVVDLPTHPSLEEEWTVITGGPELLRFGELVADLVGNDHGTCCDARTMLGVSADGQTLTILVAEQYAKGWTAGWGPWFWGNVIEKAFWSRPVAHGITYTQGALFLRKRGCTGALNLDGGGSAEIVVRINGALRILNRPTEGHERPLPNGLAFRLRR